jgi:hypothetical protein
MRKQTSIEWLFDWIESNMHEENFNILSAKETAMQMHKEEIENAYCRGAWDMAHNDQIWPREKAEQYYAETYGGQDA